ncbi:hypothetical protein ZIOFF_034302 [Zingiber officinale]|uniref:Uncharacterized protein n=1 Tax=Zingiber officinale TaxID=94328 RepID=A0A8J5GS28_ZINOF|nr:hypothetical protein ZIOFF_034302 [Zingiber officinale]
MNCYSIELASRDKFVIQTLNRVDSDVKCMIALFKKGLIEAIVLIFLLNPLLETLIELDIANAVLMAIAKKDDELIKMCMNPMTASVLILWKILQEGNSGLSNIVRSIISDRVLDRILLSLEAKMVEAATGIVLKCMGEDGHSRKLIAERVQLAPVLESFAIVNDMDRFQIICFLFKLAKLSRRLSKEKLLQAIKGGGAFSMTHSLLIYLQTTSMEQSPCCCWSSSPARSSGRRKMLLKLGKGKWPLLYYMLSLLPDTGVRGAAQVCLMKQFITILKSARHTDEKALSMLALRSFMHDQEGLFNLTLYIKDILKTLRELKKSSILAYEMLKLLSDGHDSSIKELMQVDCSANGEVISVICFKNMIFSGHLDGMIKVWKGGENLLSLLQETHEHSKAVTSLAIVKSGDKLYSGALDKTIRVLSWNGGSKTFNSSKNVKSLVLVQGKLCCGCNDSSIQEIDWATETSVTIHPGKKKLLGKETPIYAVQLRDGLLFSAGMFVDGVAVKVRQRTLFVDGVAGLAYDREDKPVLLIYGPSFRKIESSQATAKHTAELLWQVISQQQIIYMNQAASLIDVVKAVGEQLIKETPVDRLCYDFPIVIPRI